MQNDRVIAYASQQLRNPKKNYPTRDPKLVVVVHSFKMWRHYLIINKCDTHTDYKSLMYSISRNAMNMRQHKWLELIKDYELGIHYHPGKAQIEANGLNRKNYWNTLVPTSDRLSYLKGWRS